MQHKSVTRRFQRNIPEEQVQQNATQQCYKEPFAEINPKAAQCNATQQCNKKISEKYLGGTNATQCNATVLEGNFTRNKPKCNATQHNTTVQQEDIREIT